MKSAVRMESLHNNYNNEKDQIKNDTLKEMQDICLTCYNLLKIMCRDNVSNKIECFNNIS